MTFDSEYNLISEAMIDIRYNIFLAWKNKIINNETKKIMVKIAKSIYFPYRTYDSIIEKAIDLFPSKRESFLGFKNYIINYRTSLKETDALKTLQYVSSLIE